MKQRFRVVSEFAHASIVYGPLGRCGCAHLCTKLKASECMPCQSTKCKCSCTLNTKKFGGDVFDIDIGHPKLAWLIHQKLITGDASLPGV